MPSYTIVTVTATYKRPGTTIPATGTVSFRLAATMHDGSGVVIAKGETVSATLDAAGHIAVPLASNDDAGTQPVGVTWTVLEVIDGVHAKAWPLLVSASAPGGVLDLATVAPATVTPNYSYVTTGQLFGLLGGVDGGTAAASGVLLLDGGSA